MSNDDLDHRHRRQQWHGTGTVSYTVAANTSTTPRTGTLTIAGQTVTVTQAGACTYTVAPTTQSVLAAGGSQSAAVTTASGCNWTGVSNRQLDHRHGRQQRHRRRHGDLQRRGAHLAELAHGDADDCRTDGHGHAGRHVQLHDRPNHAKLRRPVGRHSTAVTTTSGCGWTGVSNNTTWITVTSGSSGTGERHRELHRGRQHREHRPRTGTLTIAGQTMTVTQAGACAYTVAPTTQSVLVGWRIALGGGHHDQRLRLDRREQ